MLKVHGFPAITGSAKKNVVDDRAVTARRYWVLCSFGPEGMGSSTHKKRSNLANQRLPGILSANRVTFSEAFSKKLVSKLSFLSNPRNCYFWPSRYVTQTFKWFPGFP